MSATRTPKRRIKKPAPPAVYVPHNATILSVDTAEKSGWCLTHNGGYVFSGMVRSSNPAAVSDVIKMAIAHAAPDGSHVVLVLEKPHAQRGRRGGHRTNIATLVGMGAARGTWLTMWKLAGMPASRVVSVAPDVWRRRVMGGQGAVAEQVVASAWAKREVTQPDEAAACCIAQWARFAGEVVAVLPKVQPC